MNKQYYQPPISGGCFLCTKMPVYSSHAGKLPHKLGKTDKDTSISGSIKQVALKYQDVIAKQMKERQAKYCGNQHQKVDFGPNGHKSKLEPTTQRKELEKIIFMKYG